MFIATLIFIGIFFYSLMAQVDDYIYVKSQPEPKLYPITLRALYSFVYRLFIGYFVLFYLFDWNYIFWWPATQLSENIFQLVLVGGWIIDLIIQIITNGIFMDNDTESGIHVVFVKAWINIIFLVYTVFYLNLII